jgi:AraC-like DNA-binding protein
VIVSHQPAPALRQVVRYYYQVVTHVAGSTAIQPVPARSPQAIEFTFGAPYEVRRLDIGITRRAYPIALIGAQTFRRVELLMQGSTDAFTIVFQPGGVPALFCVPAVELTNEDFEGEVVLGKGLSALHGRLADVSAFAQRCRIADEHLMGLLPGLGAKSHIAQTAARVLLDSGCTRVDDLACATGLGMRQFERRFRQEIGMPPKLYARIVRFEAALRRKAATPAIRWTEVAHDLGYHDQAHMVRDFNTLSGDNPTNICGQLGMFVIPEVDASGRFA